MREILNNKFMMMSAVTNELTSSSGSRLNYDYDEVIYDVASGVSSFLSESNIDRRVVAVGAEPRIHIWDLLSSNLDGWRDHTYISANAYSQMFIDIKKPSKTFISEPDRKFEVIAALNEAGSEIYFMNNECLYFFENYVRDLNSYPFSFPYYTLDQEDLEDSQNGVTFDLMDVSMVDLVSDPTLFTTYLNKLNSGGMMLIVYSNESGRLYSDDYYIEPITEVFDIILGTSGITTYHMPNSIGYQVVVKD